MSDKNSDTPSLSQYFQNDPPSLFDEIGTSNDCKCVFYYVRKKYIFSFTTWNSKKIFISGLQFTSIKSNAPTNPSVNSDFLQSFQPNESSTNIPDEIKDLWEQPFIEAGIPPILTMPGVMIMDDLNDPIRESVTELLGDAEASQRKLLSPDDVTQDERGLRNLIEAECYRSAINLTGRLLTMYGQGYGRSGQPAKHTPHSLQLWFTRFALLLKLGHSDLCQAEIEAFGALNRSDIYYEYYPEMYMGRKGSMASFSFRLLHAELPLYMGSFKLSMDRLSDLLATCNQIRQFLADDSKYSPDVVEFWQKREIRVQQSLINCAISMKDFHLVEIIFNNLSQNKLDNEENRALHSAWGRIYLQCGDIMGAEKKFTISRNLRQNSTIDTRELIDRGLIAVSLNDFHEAYLSFQKAFQLDPSNIMVQ